MNETATDISPGSKWRWRRRGLMLLYALSFLVVIQWGLAKYVAMQNDAMIDELEKLSGATTLRMMVEGETHISGFRKGNAYPFFLSAYEVAVRELPSRFQTVLYPMPETDPSPEFLQACEGGLDEAHRIIAHTAFTPFFYSHAHWEDGANTELKYFQDINVLNSLYRHSIEHNTRQGNIAKAGERICDGVLVGCKVMQEPTMVSMMIGIHTLSIALEHAEDILPSLDADCRKQLVTQLSGLNLEEMYRRARMSDCFFASGPVLDLENYQVDMGLAFLVKVYCPLWIELDKRCYLRLLLPILRAPNPLNVDLANANDGIPFYALQTKFLNPLDDTCVERIKVMKARVESVLGMLEGGHGHRH